MSEMLMALRPDADREGDLELDEADDLCDETVIVGAIDPNVGRAQRREEIVFPFVSTFLRQSSVC
ncbi:MAG: hypothetical protein R3C49_20585 [Planctomycetaceae bacterium]